MKRNFIKIQGEREIQSMQQQTVIDDLISQMTQVQSHFYVFSDIRPKPLFPADPVLTQHLRSVEMSQQSRQPPATSSNNPESPHEPKGRVGRPSNDHGVPTDTRNKTLYGGNLDPPAISLHKYQTWDGEKHNSEHVTQKGEPAKRLSREHYVFKRAVFVIMRT